MKKINIIIALFLLVVKLIAQDNNILNLNNIADSLYTTGKYAEASKIYSEIFESGKSNPNYLVSASKNAALSGDVDFSFKCLTLLVESQKSVLPVEFLTNKAEFSNLKNDERWNNLVKILSENANNEINTSLALLLQSLADEDQKWRNLLVSIRNNEHINDTITKEFVSAKIQFTDSLNYYQLKDIADSVGYPNYDIAGTDGEFNFWLLVQHQDKHPEFQDSILTLMKKEVENGKAYSKNYAYLLDRVKINSGQLQVYGTQMKLNNEKTSYEPMPVIEPEKLNERRESMGLGSIEKYIEQMNSEYFGTLKK